MVSFSPSEFVITVFLSNTRSEESEEESSLEQDDNNRVSAPKRHKFVFVIRGKPSTSQNQNLT